MARHPRRGHKTGKGRTVTEKAENTKAASKEAPGPSYASEGDDETTAAAEERAAAMDEEQARQADMAAAEQKYNEAAYAKSIEGQELPPSVQEEQDAASKEAKSR